MKSILTSIAASTLLAALAAAQPQYTVTDLGTLGGPGTSSNPFGLNAIGWVAGSSNLVASGPQHSFFWFGFGPPDGPRHAGRQEMHHLQQPGKRDERIWPDCSRLRDR